MSRFRLLALFFGLVAMVGCASFSGPNQEGGRMRAASTPAYNYLVARQLEFEGRTEEALAAYQHVLSLDPESLFLLRRVARIAAQLGKFDEARSYADRAYRLDPSDLDTRVLLGRLHQHRQEFEEAQKLFTNDEGEPINVDAAVGLFSVQMEEKHFEAALGTAKWLVRQEPESLRSYISLADVNEKLENYAEAEAALREGLKIAPENLAIYAQLADYRRRRGDRKGEMEIYREVLAIYPHHHGTLRALANVQSDQGQTAAALKTIEEIVRYYPKDANAQLRRALLNYQLKNYGLAVQQLNALVEKDPSRYEIQFFRGVVLRKLDKLDLAIASFDVIPPEDSRYVDARTQLSSIYEQRHDWGKAIEELQRVRKLQPSSSLDLYLAGLMVKDGRAQDAIDFVEQLRKAEPKNEDVLYNLGVLQGEAGRRERSLDTMNQVLALNPDHAGALNYIGYSWAERGQRLHEAEAMISHALEQRPNDGYITDSLGWVYYMRGMALTSSDRQSERLALLRKSVQELTKAVQLTGGDPIVSEHLGDAYLALDKKESALANYREALNSDSYSGDEQALRAKIKKLVSELGAP